MSARAKPGFPLILAGLPAAATLLPRRHRPPALQALQALQSGQVGDDEHARLQGVLASLASLASVIGPVVIAQAYFASDGWLPGLVWVVDAGLGLLRLPLIWRRRAG